MERPRCGQRRSFPLSAVELAREGAPRMEDPEFEAFETAVPLKPSCISSPWPALLRE